MNGEERQPAAEVERPAPAPAAASAAVEAELSPLQGSVIGLSRGVGNAAVSRALTAPNPPPNMGALAALARSRARASTPHAPAAGAPDSEPAAAAGDALGAGVAAAVARRGSRASPGDDDGDARTV